MTLYQPPPALCIAGDLNGSAHFPWIIYNLLCVGEIKVSFSLSASSASLLILSTRTSHDGIS